MLEAGALAIDLQRGVGVRLVLRGEVDLSTVGLFAEALRAAEATDAPLTIDLTEVGFMDSTGMLEIFRASQRADAKQREFAVVAPRSGPTARLFELCGTEELLAGPQHRTGRWTRPRLAG